MEYAMSARLQVTMDEIELAEIRAHAAALRMTVAEWVRQALRSARREHSSRDRLRKLAVVEDASQHSFPAGDIDRMLAEIDQGYDEVLP